jgi:hypothetical protein
MIPVTGGSQRADDSERVRDGHAEARPAHARAGSRGIIAIAGRRRGGAAPAAAGHVANDQGRRR